MTPDEIIREGRELCSEMVGTTRFAMRVKRVLSAALDALEAETKRAERAEAIANEPCGCDPAPGLRAMIESGGDKLASRLVEAEKALAAYEQTSGDLCPVCGWRGICGDDGCAFCAHEHAQGRMDPEWVVGRRMLAAALERAEKAEAALAALKDRIDSDAPTNYSVCLDCEDKQKAALAKAEADRDEARRMYCRVRAEYTGYLLCEDPADPRITAEREWPDAADRLFPGGGK